MDRGTTSRCLSRWKTSRPRTCRRPGSRIRSPSPKASSAHAAEDRHPHAGQQPGAQGRHRPPRRFRVRLRRGRPADRRLPPHGARPRVRRLRDGAHHLCHRTRLRQAHDRPADLPHASVPPRRYRMQHARRNPLAEGPRGPQGGRESWLHRHHGPLGAQRPRPPVWRGPREDHLGALRRRARRRVRSARQRRADREGPEDGRPARLGRARRGDRRRGRFTRREAPHRQPEGSGLRSAARDGPLPDQSPDGGQGRRARRPSRGRPRDLRRLRRGEAPLCRPAARRDDRKTDRGRRDAPARDGYHRKGSPALRHRAQPRDAGRGHPQRPRAGHHRPPGRNRNALCPQHPRAGRLTGSQEETMTVQEITRKPPVSKKPQVAIMNAVHDLPVLAARDLGFFKDEGLDIDFITTPGMAQVTTKHFVKFDTVFDRPLDSVYNEGGIDQYRMCEWGIMKRAVEAEAQNIRRRKIVALGASMSMFAIAVRKDSKFYAPEMLKDQLIAVTPNNGSHFTTLKMMEGFLEPEHLKVTNVGTMPQRLQGLEDGKVAALRPMEPWVSVAQKPGLLRLISSHPTRAEAPGCQPHRENLRRMFRAQARAVDALEKDPTPFIKYFVAETGGLIEERDFQSWRLLHAPPTEYTRERFDDEYNWTVKWNMTVPGATFENTVDNRAWG